MTTAHSIMEADSPFSSGVALSGPPFVFSAC